MVCSRLVNDGSWVCGLGHRAILVWDRFDVAEYLLKVVSLNDKDLESQVLSEKVLALDLTGTCGAQLAGGDKGFCLRWDFGGGIEGRLLAGGGEGKRLYVGEKRVSLYKESLWLNRNGDGFRSPCSEIGSMGRSSSGIVASSE